MNGNFSDILQKVKNLKRINEEVVIYGVYDNSNASWVTRLNDFLIDHSSVSLREKSHFFHMLAVMVDSGITVVSAVKGLARHTENKRFKRVLSTVAYNTENGISLVDAMSRFDDIFEESELGIVRAGEATGRLNTSLFKLSSQLDKSYALSMKLWGAAAYPLVVVSVLILVSVGMLMWVFPTLLSLLTDGGVAMEDLPLMTRILIELQGFFVGYWWVVVIGILGAFGFFKFYVGSNYGATKWDYFKLHIPLIGGLMRKIYVYRFVDMLGLLVDSGLPMIQALTITGNSISNRIYKLKSKEIVEAVRNGEKISECLEDVEFLFPYEVVQMLRVGESSASLAKVSEKISIQYQREVDSALKKMTSMFEPIMILFVGLFVAMLAMAIMAPIFNLNNIAGV